MANKNVKRAKCSTHYSRPYIGPPTSSRVKANLHQVQKVPRREKRCSFNFYLIFFRGFIFTNKKLFASHEFIRQVGIIRLWYGQSIRVIYVLCKNIVFINSMVIFLWKQIYQVCFHVSFKLILVYMKITYRSLCPS